LTPDSCEGHVGGIPLRCAGEVASLIRLVDRALPDHRPGLPRIEYRASRLPDGSFVLFEGERVVATTPHEPNLFGLLREDVPRFMEQRYPDSIWLHACGMQHPDGWCVALAGRSGMGKSTAAMTLARHGWRYLCDDRLMFDLQSRTVIGMNFPIQLGKVPVDAEGFDIFASWWIAEGLEHRMGLLMPQARAIPPGPMPLRKLVFLDRGPKRLETMSAGAMLVRLWPERIARMDGREPCGPSELAEALSAIETAVMWTNQPCEVGELLA